MDEKLKQLQAIINEWESLDKEAFILDVIKDYLSEEQLDVILSQVQG